MGLGKITLWCIYIAQAGMQPWVIMKKTLNCDIRAMNNHDYLLLVNVDDSHGGVHMKATMSISTAFSF